SIALSIIEGAAAEAARHDVKVAAVRLRMGALSGVAPDALLFAYELACAGTALAGSRLLIEETPVVVFCPRCQTERALASIRSFRCPVCDTSTPEVVRGRELELVALEVSE